MGAFQVNSYVLRCESTGATVVVDPGDEPEILLRRLDELGVSPVAILNTHGHIDHVAGNAALKERYGIPIWMHPDDRFLLDAFPQQAAMFGLELTPPPPPDEELVPGRSWTFGDVTLDVHFTPGHSPGHVAFVHDRLAISGDVLFAGSIGRTDLPRGDLPTLLRSIDEVLVPLGDEVTIWPGHGPSTTIGDERRSNPFLAPELRSEILRRF
ncbi:MAG: MBL fold metallo-hydrolase [bacterium]